MRIHIFKKDFESILQWDMTKIYDLFYLRLH